MTLEELVRAKREEILCFCGKYGARSVRVFGSLARGQADEGSDVDFLVELEPGRTLLDLGGLQQELEALLGRWADVVTIRASRGGSGTSSSRCRSRMRIPTDRLRKTSAKGYELLTIPRSQPTQTTLRSRLTHGPYFPWPVLGADGIPCHNQARPEGVVAMLRPFTEEEALEHLLEGVEDPTLAKTVASLLSQSPDDLVATGNAKDALQALQKALTTIVDRTIEEYYEDIAASDLGEEWQ